jgi:hypothetical protein
MRPGRPSSTRPTRRPHPRLANTRFGASVRSRPALWRARYFRYEGKEPSDLGRDGVLRVVQSGRLTLRSGDVRSSSTAERRRRRRRFCIYGRATMPAGTVLAPAVSGTSVAVVARLV